MYIRELKKHDANSLMELMRKISLETNYMLYRNDELYLTTEEVKKNIDQIHHETYSKMFMLIDDNNQLAGYCIARGNKAKRKCHCVTLVIGIIKKHTGKGFGTKLILKIEEWAKKNFIERIELSVVSENIKALSFYIKKGFVLEGIQKKSLKLSVGYHDEFMLTKYI